MEQGTKLRAGDWGMPQRKIFERGISHYRCLQLLTEGFNDLFALFHGVFNEMMIAFAVMCVYGFLRTGGLMAGLLAYVGIWCLVCYFQLTNIYAEVNRGSTGVLHSLRVCWHDRGGHSGGRSALIAWRELRSLRELRIKGGDSLFHYDKSNCFSLPWT